MFTWELNQFSSCRTHSLKAIFSNRLRISYGWIFKKKRNRSCDCLFYFIIIPTKSQIWSRGQYAVLCSTCTDAGIENSLHSLRTVARSGLYNPQWHCTAGESGLSPSGKLLTTDVNCRRTHYTPV